MALQAMLAEKKIPVVEMGNKNREVVSAIQTALTKLGYYNFLVDGKYGIKTDAAVRVFQNDNHVSVDGDVGRVTAGLIDMRLGVAPVVVAQPTKPAQSFPYQTEYDVLWKTMIITPSKVKLIDQVVGKLRQPQRWAEYCKLFDATGVPPQVTAVINERECGGNLKGVLHNGELIVGTNRKTKLVPAGRGPFATFFDAGVDAFKKEGLDTFDWHAGGAARVAYALEKFNGFGYRKKGVHSPYLWAGTNQYTRGKYISDGNFSPTHVDTQLGGMAVLRRMMDLDTSLKF